MINVFYGRENLNKEEFIYNRIFEKNKRSIVIVPDQYGLEAEKAALKYAREYRDAQWIEKKSQNMLSSQISLINVEIKTFSRLMHDVFNELGGLNTIYVDRVGREIILSKVLRELDYKKMHVFANQIRKPGFAKVIGDFISQVKLENLSPNDIAKMAELSRDEIELYGKLADLAVIFEAYEKALKGTFSDNEDRYNGFINKIEASKYLSSVDFWFYGFDSFTGKAYKIIEGLANKAKNSKDGSTLNFVINYDGGKREHLFKAGQIIISRLERIQGIDSNRDIRISQIGDEYGIQKADDLKHLEENLYKLSPDQFNGKRENIRIIKAQNAYYEAEACAAHIRKLLRERNFRKRDIAILCNDGDSRISILKRILQDYDIELFVDSRKPISKEPFVRYLISAFDVIGKKYSTYYVINFIKNPFSTVFNEDLAVEKLDAYARRHRIQGNMWKKDFIYFDSVMRENRQNSESIDNEKRESIAEINNLRKKAIEPLLQLENIVNISRKNKATVRAFAGKYFAYLKEIANLNNLENDVLWKSIVSTMDQIVELIGDERFELDIFREAFFTGLEAVTVGNTPPSVDDLLVGSTQRTRTGPIKSLVVLGMNEGLIPKQNEQESLITKYELSLVEKQNSDSEDTDSIFSGLIAKTENLDREERLAIYRNFSKPTEDIWISFISNNLKGEEQLPSELIDDFNKMFGEKTDDKSMFTSIVEKSPVSKKDYIVESPQGALTNLARFYSLNNSENITPELAAGEVWIEEFKNYRDANAINMKLGALDILKNVRDYEYVEEPLSRDLITKLYSSDRYKNENEAIEKLGSEEKSSSDEKFGSDEKYGSDEKSDSNVIGKTADAPLRLSPSKLEQFSRCPYKYFVNFGLKPASNEPIEYKNTDIGTFMHDVMEKFCLWADDGNKWVELKSEDVHAKIDEFVDDFSERNLSLLFPQTGQERYITERVRGVVRRAADTLHSFRKTGNIDHSEYEKGFKYQIYGTDEKPAATIHGFVDRIDYMNVNEEQIFTIIDYKTGEKSFKGKYIEGGYDLQLFIYVAAIEAEADEKNGDSGNLKAMGAFYINLNDENRNNRDGEFKMNGAVVEEIGEIIGKNYAKLISRAKDKSYPAASMSKEEFDKYKTDVAHQVTELCHSIMEGDVAIRPLKIDAEADACKYCEFGDICRYSSYYNKVLVG